MTATLLVPKDKYTKNSVSYKCPDYIGVYELSVAYLNDPMKEPSLEIVIKQIFCVFSDVSEGKKAKF